MFCRYCGKEIDELTSFCVYCGKPTNKGVKHQNQRLRDEQLPINNPPSPGTIIDTTSTKDAQVSTAIADGAPPVTAGTFSIPVNNTPSSSVPTMKKPTTIDDLVNPVAPANIYANQTAATQFSNKRVRLIAIAAVIIAAIIAIVLLGSGTNWFGLGQVPVRNSVNEYSWDELSRISSTIAGASDEYQATEIAKRYNIVNSSGKLDGAQTKSVTLSDDSVIDVQVAGIWHDERADGKGKAGLTFIFKNGISTQMVNTSKTNSGGWEQSQIRSWMTNEGMAMLPADLRDKILSVKKKNKQHWQN